MARITTKEYKQQAIDAGTSGCPDYTHANDLYPFAVMYRRGHYASCSTATEALAAMVEVKVLGYDGAHFMRWVNGSWRPGGTVEQLKELADAEGSCPQTT